MHAPAAGARAWLDERVGGDQVAVVVEQIRRLLGGAPTETDGGADLRGPCICQFRHARPQMLGNALERGAAFWRRQLRPGATIEGSARRGNRGLGVGMRWFGVAQQAFFGVRRDDIQRLAAGAGAPLTIDE